MEEARAESDALGGILEGVQRANAELDARLDALEGLADSVR